MARILVVFLFIFQCMAAQKPFKFEWNNPASFKNFPENLGFAGMASAKSERGFLLAGGANFPDKLPWEGGKKFFSDKVFFWNENSDAPEEIALKLPIPLAYSGYVGYEEKLIIIGGETANGPTKKCWIVSKNDIKELPELPEALMSPSAILLNGKVFIAGGDTKDKTLNQFIVLNLSDKSKGWVKCANIPFSTSNAAIFSTGKEIFVASGRSKNKNGISTLHSEVYKYDIKKNQWNLETAVQIDGKSSPFVASSYFTYKNRYLVFCGGDDGKIFNKIETLISKANSEKEETSKEQLISAKNYIVKHHLGFTNKILIYDTKSKKWHNSGNLPFTAHVTTSTVFNENRVYIFSGEVRPGIRSPKIWVGILK